MSDLVPQSRPTLRQGSVRRTESVPEPQGVHDAACEAEWESGAMAWTDCACDLRSGECALVGCDEKGALYSIKPPTVRAYEYAYLCPTHAARLLMNGQVTSS